MIRILIDSSSDYTAAEAHAQNMDFVSIMITLGDKSYSDGIDLDRNAFYKLIEESGEFPKTSQPSPAVFQEIFEDVKAKNDEIICILLSSALSGTYQSACLAKSMTEYDGIYIVDSLSATAAIRIMADYACRLRDAGMSAKQIAASVEDLKPRVKILAALDTLEYLYRGGRLNKTTAVIGNTVRLKPIITLTGEGEVKMIDKQIGKRHSMKAIIRQLDALSVDKDFPFYSIYSYGTDNSELFESQLKEAYYPVGTRLQIGTTIGSHIGPDAYGVVFVTK